MIINATAHYFLMSFRFNKQTAKDFDLIPSGNFFIHKHDGSVWIEKKLYDLGWGKENGFMRLPELSFDDLCSSTKINLARQLVKEIAGRINRL